MPSFHRITNMSHLVWIMVALSLVQHIGEPLVAAEAPPSSQTESPTKAASPGWVKLSNQAAFSPRDTAEDFVFDGKMWLSNGYYHGNVLHRDLWSSPDGVTWTLVNPNTPYDGYSEMVVHDGRIWAVKGSVWNSTDGVKWTQVAEKTPFGTRGYGELVVFRDRMWQLGSGADVWHSADGVKWTCATKAAPFEKRAASAVVAFDDRLWLLGGRIDKQADPPEKGYEQYTTFNDVWSSPDGATWTRVLANAPWTPRMWFISKAYADRIWIIGGYDNANHKNLGDVWYSEDGEDWQKFTSKAQFEPRHEPTCYVFNKSLWVVAGNTWPVRNDVWRLTLP